MARFVEVQLNGFDPGMTCQQATQCSWNLCAKGAIPSIEKLLSVLHTIRERRDLKLSLYIHACICGFGLEAQTHLGNYLVSLLIDIGNANCAQQIFVRLLYHDEISIGPLIGYYADNEEFLKAILLYAKTPDNFSFHAYVFVALLRSCTVLKNLDVGCQIHSNIARRDFREEDRLLACMTMNMYANCGSPERAQEVFDKLQGKDIISWRTLILAYVNHGQDEKALKCFERMQKDGIILDTMTVVLVLKLCGMIGDVFQGHTLHDEVVKRGWLEENIFILTALVGMYGRCGFLDNAQDVFNKLPISNEVSWITMMAALVDHGWFEETLFLHRRMIEKGIPPHPGTLVCSLKACGCIGTKVDGQELHIEIVKKGLDGEIVISNTLIDMYSKCSLLLDAQAVFDRLANRNIVSWTALVGGFVDCGYDEIALQLLGKMESLEIVPDATTSICSLKACCISQTVAEGHRIHANIVKFGHSEVNNFVGATLVHMYAKCGVLEEAQHVLTYLSRTSVVAWNALLAGYVDYGCGEEAVSSCEKIIEVGVPVDPTTFGYFIVLCGRTHNSERSYKVHKLAVIRGMDIEERIGSSLVDMYVQCGLLSEAHEILSTVPHSANSWSSLIAGYADHGCGEEALMCFIQATSNNVCCTSLMFVGTLKACILTPALKRGREIHSLVVKQGFLEVDVAVSNALVSLYAKYGLIEEAYTALKGFSVRGLIAWTSLISGCVDYGHHDEALDCFQQMRQEVIFPDSIAFTSSLSACSSTGSSIMGLRMHADINKAGLETELNVVNAVIDMYAKCGSMREAQCVFGKLAKRDVVSWNALITGYAQLGQSETVFQTVDKMVEDGIHPDKYTYFSILNVCSHVGSIKTGQLKFRDLIEAFNLTPTFEHFTCMVDLFAHAGCVEFAVELVKRIPFHPDLIIWRAVLGACRMHGYLELGRHAFQQVMWLNDRDATTYVNVSNLFVDAGTFMQD